MKIEHIGIAIRDLGLSNSLFEKLLGSAHYKTEEVTAEGVKTSFFKAGSVKVELLEAMGEDSPIARFVEKRGEGLHHIAFVVDDLEAEIERLEKEGFSMVNRSPKRGADNKMVVFLHPKLLMGYW